MKKILVLATVAALALTAVSCCRHDKHHGRPPKHKQVKVQKKHQAPKKICRGRTADCPDRCGHR